MYTTSTTYIHSCACTIVYAACCCTYVYVKPWTRIPFGRKYDLEHIACLGSMIAYITQTEAVNKARRVEQSKKSKSKEVRVKEREREWDVIAIRLIYLEIVKLYHIVTHFLFFHCRFDVFVFVFFLFSVFVVCLKKEALLVFLLFSLLLLLLLLLLL